MKMTFGLPLLALAAMLCLPVSAAAGDAARHWTRPAEASGGDLLPSPSSLLPGSCAECHPTQHADCSGALHAKSIGPGLTGQLAPDASPALAASCYFCHAPLAEQSEYLTGDASAGGYAGNPAYDPALKRSGVSCAACHARGGVIYGPPSPNVGARDRGHDTTERAFFADSAFCAACHQLDGGFELGGKLLVNTYREWSESPFASAGVTCQNCHMSGRRHLFRGIHDPAMTRSGVEMEAQAEWSGRGIRSELRITNTGTGHYFPTYVTPEVRLACFLAGPGGAPVIGTRQEGVIARRVSVDLEREEFDTRLAPGKAHAFECRYDEPPPGATAVVFEVRVKPDEFYNRFFTLMAGGENPPDKQKELEEALDATVRSPYMLYRESVQVGYPEAPEGPPAR